MAQAPIISPTPANTALQWLEERSPVAQASANAFNAGEFVKIQGSGSGVTLIRVTSTSASTAEPCYGLAQKAALTSTAEPYLTPTGTTATPISPVNTEFWVNTLTTAGATGTGDATKLVAGSTYQINQFTTSGYSGIIGLDANSTAAANLGFFVYTGRIYPGYAETDTNVPVSAKIVATLIQ